MKPSALFNHDDISEAIKNTNFDKGLGPDGFDGHVLIQNADLRGKITEELVKILNDGQLPGYLLEANIVALSKAKGSNQVQPDDVRFIAVRSHLSKILEKAILDKTQKESPHLLTSKHY